MSDQPLLTMDAVREWVGDFEIGKGRPYADTAVFGCRWESGTGQLIAFVRGTRPRPYQVSVDFGDSCERGANGTVSGAFCHCPVGAEGKCKHVAAVLLAYLADPARFVETQIPEEELGERSKEELLKLVDRLLHFAPHLMPLLAVPMPGFVSGDVSPEPFRALAVEAIQTARSHDERAEEDVTEALWPLVWLGQGYRASHDDGAADALWEGVARAIRASGLGLPRLVAYLRQRPFWDVICEPLERDQPSGGEAPPF
jgi:SWIM zinc finger